MKFVKGMVIGLAVGTMTGMAVGAMNYHDICDVMKKGKKEIKRFKRKYCY